jgi:hypothetical protein
MPHRACVGLARFEKPQRGVVTKPRVEEQAKRALEPWVTGHTGIKPCRGGVEIARQNRKIREIKACITKLPPAEENHGPISFPNSRTHYLLYQKSFYISNG